MGTTLFDEYTKHGDLWYIVAKAREYSYVVGITRRVGCSVQPNRQEQVPKSIEGIPPIMKSAAVFNLTDKNKYIEYVTKEIYPVIT